MERTLDPTLVILASKKQHERRKPIVYILRQRRSSMVFSECRNSHTEASGREIYRGRVFRNKARTIVLVAC